MHVRAAFGIPLFTLGLAAVLASAQTAPVLSVTPNPAPAGKSFVLYLQGAATPSCYTTFTRESVTVTGTRIDLRYTTQTMLYPADPPVPASVCPVPVTAKVETTSIGPTPVMANLPTFPMPPLAAGKYEVWATDVPECIYSGCKIAMPAPVSAGTLDVQKQGDLSYTFTPVSAPAGQAFDLHLLSYGFTCATLFQDLAVHVVGDVITLSFTDKEQTGVACPAVYMPYGPTFKIPALQAGTYQVRVDRNMMNALVTAGNLQITSVAVRKGWYLKQRTVPPDAPFQMQLLKDSMSACTNFSNLSAVVSASGIDANFLIQTGKCAEISPTPIGPVFSMPSLKAGIYPIYVDELLPCEVTQPACLVNKMKPLPSDTLVVAKVLSARMSALRAGAPKVEVVGNTASFALPQGEAGLWRAELMTLDGRVLAGKSWTGAPGDRVSMPVDRARVNAVSLLRLTSPAGTQGFLPIVR